jgi:hypothetical protein
VASALATRLLAMGSVKQDGVVRLLGLRDGTAQAWLVGHGGNVAASSFHLDDTCKFSA